MIDITHYALDPSIIASTQKNSSTYTSSLLESIHPPHPSLKKCAVSSAIKAMPHATHHATSSALDASPLARWLALLPYASSPIACAHALESYISILLEWNHAHNLTGSHDIARAWAQVIDSALPLFVIEPFSRCIDIGSGAGFPALVLAIICSDVEFILCEPRMKRAAFLRYVINALKLVNVSIKKQRASDMLASMPLASCDLLTSRASLPSTEIIAMTYDYLSPNGHWLFYQGLRTATSMQEQAKNNINAISKQQNIKEQAQGLDSQTLLYRYNARIYVYKERA